MVDLSGNVTAEDQTRLGEYAAKVQADRDAAKARKQAFKDEIKRRKVRKMSDTIEGLREQLDAAYAQVRHTENEVLNERRRSRELAAADEEMRVHRRNSTSRG